MTVLIFGDSITYGEFDSEGGWATRFVRKNLQAMAKDGWDAHPSIYNLGVAGDTTQGVIKRFMGETKARSWEGEKVAFVFAVGVNDTLTYRGTPPVSSPELYHRELEELLGLTRQVTRKVLFVGLLPVDDTKVIELYSTERIWQFEQVLREFTQANSLPVVPLFEEFQKRIGKGERLLVDGLHPNDAGHQLIYEQVKPKLDDLTR